MYLFTKMYIMNVSIFFVANFFNNKQIIHIDITHAFIYLSTHIIQVHAFILLYTYHFLLSMFDSNWVFLIRIKLNVSNSFQFSFFGYRSHHTCSYVGVWKMHEFHLLKIDGDKLNSFLDQKERSMYYSF